MALKIPIGGGFLAVVFATFLSPGVAGGAVRDDMMVVRSLRSGECGQRAGFQPGDRPFSWRRAGRGRSGGGLLHSPIDLWEIEFNEAPIGPIALGVERDGNRIEIELAAGYWGIDARPPLPAGILDAFERFEAGETKFGVILTEYARESERSTGVWILLGVADGLPQKEAAPLLQEAVDLSEGRPFEAFVWRMFYPIAEKWPDKSTAVRAAREEFELRQRLIPGGPAAAAAALRRGMAEALRGQLDLAEEFITDAIKALEMIAPGSLELAEAYNSIGYVRGQRGDLGGQEYNYRRAMEIRERLSPETMKLAVSYNNLGYVRGQRGDAIGQESWYRRALEIRERLEPGSLPVAESYHNLGQIYGNRGDLEEWERLLRKALEIRERLAPDSSGLALTCNNLGIVYARRGDLISQDAWVRRAVDIWERAAPASMLLARGYGSVAEVYRRRGDVDSWEKWIRKAIAIQERLGPESLALAASQHALGLISRRRSESDRELEWLFRALQLRECLAPGSLTTSDSWHEIGRSLGRRGDLVGEETWLRKALKVRKQLAPGSADLSKTLWALGKNARELGRNDEASDWMRQAVEAIEQQQQRLGGSPDDLATFRSEFSDLSADLIELLIESGRRDETVGIFESNRARGLLALLAERDRQDTGLPGNLAERRLVTNKAYEKAMAALGASRNEKEREQAFSKMTEARQQQDEVRRQIRDADPDLADLRYPTPLSAMQVRRMLDQGDLLLAWTLGERAGSLVAIDRNGVEAWNIEVSRNDLRHRIRRLRSSLENPEIPMPANTLAELSKELLGPASARINRARRLILLPDGPLWLFPLQILIAPGTSAPLLENHPVTVVSSATVLDQLIRKRGERREGRRLAAFGDPVYPTEPISMPGGAVRLEPLPASRHEILQISQNFPGRSDQFLGAEATEKQARKLLGRDAAIEGRPNIVHFAAHGIVSPLLPMESGIALSKDPAREGEEENNGLLQSWEIFENFRMKADLVVLSACETALGEEVAGEGILGLTRAFQFAGARSVMASLWSVADESTPELMNRFYRGLAAGLPKDEALRAAELALRAAPVTTESGSVIDATHPAHWAAFQLYGDWD